MKYGRNHLLIIFLLFAFNHVLAQNETLSAGAFIVRMDASPATVNNSLKPYGLVYELLKGKHAPVKWVINTTKTKDGTDFTYQGVNYKGGPFIIPAEYRTAAVNAIITTWQGRGVVGVTTSTSISVPVYTTLTFAPHWTLDTDNGDLAEEYLINADIPSTAYTFRNSNAVGCCDDIYIMPHTTAEWSTHGNLLAWNKDAAAGGCSGAIWAGCRSGSNLENLFNPANKSQQLNFLMQDPSVIGGQAAVPYDTHSDGTIPPPYTLAYPSHPVMQFIGSTELATQSGSEQIYLPKVGWRPTTQIAAYDATHSQVPSLSPGAAAQIVFGYGKGNSAYGKVMYEGGHSLNGGTAHDVAAQRAFFNFSLWTLQDKAISYTTSGVPNSMYVGSIYPLSITASGGSGGYTYQWESSCGGSFSAATAASTNFTPPSVIVATNCIIKCTITDACSRQTTYIGATTIVPTPATPVAVNDSATTQTGFPITLTPLSNDSDANLDPLSIAFTRSGVGTNGTFVLNADKTVRYTPAPYFAGTDTLTYQICDTTNRCATAKMVVRVVFASIYGCMPTQLYTTSGYGYAESVFAENSISNSSRALAAPNHTTANDDWYAKLDNTSDYLVLDLGRNLASGDTVVYYVATDDGNTMTGTIEQSSNGTTFSNAQSFTTSVEWNVGIVTNNYVLTSTSRYIRFKRTVGKLVVDAVTFTIRGCVEQAPTALNDAISICQDNGGTFNVVENDFDGQGDELIATVTTNPLHGIANLTAAGVLNYLPNLSFSGTDSLTYQVCDGNGFCDEAKVYIEVNATVGCSAGYFKVPKSGYATAVYAQNSVSNATSALSEPNYESSTSSTYAKLDNPSDYLVLDLSDTITTNSQLCIYADNDNASGNATFTVETGSVNGTTFTHSNTLTVVGGEGSDTTICFEIAATSTRYIRIKTTGSTKLRVDAVLYDGCGGFCRAIPNRAPLASIDLATTPTGTPVTVNVLANDADPEGGVLTMSLLTTDPPQAGNVATIVSNQIQFTPTISFAGKDTFSYRICDPLGLCDTTQVIITTTNAPPVANNDAYTTPSATAITMTVQTNDTDPENGTLTTSLITALLPTRGSASLSGNNIIYTPVAGFIGNDTLSYSICDNATPQYCDTAQIVITVTNQAPLANNDNGTTNPCQAVTISIVSNDTDPEFGSLTAYSIVTNPANGTASIDFTGQNIVYTPNTGFTGTDVLSYRVCDDASSTKCDTATITITVRSSAVNNAPVAAADAESVTQGSIAYISVLDNDSDPDDDPLSIKFTSSNVQPLHGTVTLISETLFRYTPTAGFTGLDSFSYSLCDTLSLPIGCPAFPQQCTTAMVVMTINNSFSAPITVPDYGTTPANTPLSNSVASNDSDIDGNANFSTGFQKLTNPINGSISFSVNGSFTYSPTSGFIGQDSMTYRLCDSDGLCDTATVYFLVIASNAVGNVVFYDTNSNGIQEAGEAGVTGVTIQLYKIVSGSSVLVSQSNSDANGVYGFTNLDPSVQHFLRVTVPVSYTGTVANQHNNDETDSDINPLSSETNRFLLAVSEINNTIDIGIIPTPTPMMPESQQPIARETIRNNNKKRKVKKVK